MKHTYLSHFKRIIRTKRKLIFPIALLVVFIAAGIGTSAKHSSVATTLEAKFTDPSAHGLAIVPASGESTPFCPDGSPIPANGLCSNGSVFCPDGSRPPDGDLQRCPDVSPTNHTYLCPDGSASPNNDPNQCTCAQGNTAACSKPPSTSVLCPDNSPAPNNDPSQCTCEQGNVNVCPIITTPHLCPDGSLAPNDDTSQCTCAQGNLTACEPKKPTDPALCPDGSLAPNNDPDQCTCDHSNALVCIVTPPPPTHPTDPTPTCPAGYVQHGISCVKTSCPIGYTLLGNACVFVACPSGYNRQGNVCLKNQCTIGYVCSGDNLYYQGGSCSKTLVESCTYGCSISACLPAPAPTAAISAQPTLLQQGQTSTITWSAQNVVIGSCRVTGTNGDAWTGANGSKTSSVLTAQTIYTLRCQGLDDSDLSKQITINVVPTFQEK